MNKINQAPQIREGLIQTIEQSAKQAALFGLAVYLVSNHEDAKDLVQATYEKALRSAHTFDGSGQPDNWLRRIITNAARDRFDYDSRRPVLVLEDDWSTDTIDPCERVLDIAASEELAQELLSSGVLTDSERRVLYLYYFCDFSHEQIAKTLGIEIVTSKSHKSRAEKKLRQEWSPDES